VGRSVAIDGGDLVVRLDGWDAVAAVKRGLPLPLAAVTRASTGRFANDGWRLGGTAIPFTDVRAGRVRRHGRRQFLSFSRRAPVLIVQASRSRGAPYDVVAVEVPEPEGVAELVEEACRGAAA
jgi:hypothetical protein